MSEERSDYSTGPALVPVEQRTVYFYDDEVTAVRMGTGEVYIPVRPLCEALGVDWSAQSRRIGRDPVLSKKSMSVAITATDIDNPRAPHNQVMTCLPLDFISGWLFGINAGRVKEEVKEKLIRYQEECYAVLKEAFQEGRLTVTAEAALEFERIIQGGGDAVQAYQIATAVAKLARNQLLMESRLHGRIDDHEERLEQIEATLGDHGRHVSPDQASQLSQAVKAVAIAQGKVSKRNEFGAVYGELYRKFGITSYKLLPARQFEEAMGFLTEWYLKLEDDVPF